MTSLINITPQADWDIDCGDSYCDGYGCEIHDSYLGGKCEIANCTSPVSSYLVLINNAETNICNYHFN
jgi:hypothetical protein